MGQAISYFYRRRVLGNDDDEEGLYWYRRMGQQILRFLDRLLGARNLPSDDQFPIYHNSADHYVDIGITDCVLQSTIPEVAIILAEEEVVEADHGANYDTNKLSMTRVVNYNVDGGGSYVTDNISPARPIYTSQGSLGPYSWDQKILLVGEGDFSFSTSLAIAFGNASNMVATSLNHIEFLKKNYKRAEANLEELKSRGCKIMHGVDATKMASSRRRQFLIKFDRIVYNFPHAGFANLQATRDVQITKHQELVRGFLSNAKTMIKDDGQIHITHKCVGFSQKWNLKDLGSSEGLKLVQESRFNLQDYPGYSPKYGYGGDGNFDCKPSKTYKFQLQTSNKKKKTRSEKIT